MVYHYIFLAVFTCIIFFIIWKLFIQKYFKEAEENDQYCQYYLNKKYVILSGWDTDGWEDELRQLDKIQDEGYELLGISQGNYIMIKKRF